MRKRADGSYLAPESACACAFVGGWKGCRRTGGRTSVVKVFTSICERLAHARIEGAWRPDGGWQGVKGRCAEAGGASRKGLNQDLQNWEIGRIRAVVGNSSVVQTVRPEIDQGTDCKTMGVRQPKIGDRPN